LMDNLEQGRGAIDSTVRPRLAKVAPALPGQPDVLKVNVAMALGSRDGS
jgi:hypothetical protein